MCKHHTSPLRPLGNSHDLICSIIITPGCEFLFQEQAALPTPILGYSVTAEHTVVGTQETIDAYDAKTKSNCGGVCSHTINIHPDLSSTSSSVTGKVAAINSVGTGAFCQGPHISK